MGVLENSKPAFEESGVEVHKRAFQTYLELLSYMERLHRLLLDVIKDEFERIGQSDLNSIQALLIFNIGENELTAGELRSRGYYQGSNVSYNLKKMVEAGYIHHERCQSDRRSVRIKLTEKGKDVQHTIMEIYKIHIDEMMQKSFFDPNQLYDMNESMKNLEKYWSSKIRYIY
jgi:DNA-binding MarR family transcriptional regulator